MFLVFFFYCLWTTSGQFCPDVDFFQIYDNKDKKKMHFLTVVALQVLNQNHFPNFGNLLRGRRTKVYLIIVNIVLPLPRGRFDDLNIP